ncbi:3'-5' exonuclease [Dermabacteraceae bacterium P13128]
MKRIFKLIRELVKSDEVSHPTASVASVPFPRLYGVPIYEHLSEVSRLKRENRNEEALELAMACAKAMADAARSGNGPVMEHYVIETTIIQTKLKRHEEVIATIDGWFALGLEPGRLDDHVSLQKRLAKARESLARSRGEDATQYTQAWREYVAEEKRIKAEAAAGRIKITGVRSGQVSVGGEIPSGRNSHSIYTTPPSQLAKPVFVAVDFETANREGTSACQVALVKVSDGQVVDRYVSYLKPPSGSGRFEFTHLHGISRKDVADAPTWQEIASTVAEFCAGVPVYAHNAQFDKGVWQKLDAHYGTVTLPPDFFCSYRTARNVMPGLEDYKLPTVAAHCIPEYRLNHHQADSDAEACGLIIAALQRHAGLR